MAEPCHLPSVLWCAVGFCAAGSGIGSLIGTMVLQSWLYPPQDRMLVYSGTFLGIKLGMLIGVVTGVVYAVRVRRSRLQHVGLKPPSFRSNIQ